MGCFEIKGLHAMDFQIRRAPFSAFGINSITVYPWPTKSRGIWFLLPLFWLSAIPFRDTRRPGETVGLRALLKSRSIQANLFSPRGKYSRISARVFGGPTKVPSLRMPPQTRLDPSGNCYRTCR